jgi:protein-tyrosine phosphatase
MHRILFVCMGNICRSPAAEGMLRARLTRDAPHWLDRIEIDSAGTHGYHGGRAPDPRMQQAARARGIDLSALRARAVQPEDFLRFTHILAMDEANLAELERLRPDGHPNRPALLMSFARRHAAVREVPDPYYGGPDGFDRVLDLVEDACDGLLAHLRQRLAGGAAEAG